MNYLINEYINQFNNKTSDATNYSEEPSSEAHLAKIHNQYAAKIRK